MEPGIKADVPHNVKCVRSDLWRKSLTIFAAIGVQNRQVCRRLIQRMFDSISKFLTITFNVTFDTAK